jgi:PKD repeat protein
LRWRAVAIAAALLTLGTTAAAQGTGSAAAAPGPAPSAGPTSPSWLGSARSLVDSVQLEAGYTYDDNVTLGRAHEDILWDQALWFDLSASRAFRVDDHARLVVTGLLNGEKFFNYNGLSNLSGGLEAELQYRRSGAFDAITFAAFARGWLDNYSSHLRDGSHYSLGVSARGALTDRLGLSGEVAWNQRRAQSEVWDLTDWSARLNLDYSLEERGTLYLNGEYRRGDVVSDGHATLVNVSLAQVFVSDDAFPGKDLFAYRSDARTWISTLGYNLPLGQRSSLDFSWRRVESTPTANLGFDVQGSLRYVDNQYTVVFLKLF